MDTAVDLSVGLTHWAKLACTLGTTRPWLTPTKTRPKSRPGVTAPDSGMTSEAADQHRKLAACKDRQHRSVASLRTDCGARAARDAGAGVSRGWARPRTCGR